MPTEEDAKSIIRSSKKQRSRDIRDVISLGKLIRKLDGPEEIEELVKMLAKYTDVN